MRPVRLSRRLVLEAPERTADGAGGHVTSWTARGTLWADLRPGAGRTRDGGEVSLARAGCRIIVRAAPPGAGSRPEAGMRLVDGARVFSIEAVADHDARRRFLTCFAFEETAV
ncbi:head-tail adaptor protein [Shimia sp.]|uniref:head-tail adaptor protein n=1 Tax=Shimia sp. TaxID=1954381 RepID=UPI0035686C1B